MKYRSSIQKNTGDFIQLRACPQFSKSRSGCFAQNGGAILWNASLYDGFVLVSVHLFENFDIKRSIQKHRAWGDECGCSSKIGFINPYLVFHASPCTAPASVCTALCRAVGFAEIICLNFKIERSQFMDDLIVQFQTSSGETATTGHPLHPKLLCAHHLWFIIFSVQIGQKGGKYEDPKEGDLQDDFGDPYDPKRLRVFVGLKWGSHQIRPQVTLVNYQKNQKSLLWQRHGKSRRKL